ncbi:hypothetical protein CAPTEDRAFT_184896 [Capitella teleta]|uniref:Cytochrome P450 n=1 Tax=Capitella teleta TaxID=283909 RepID=X1ZH78_CAPTE|nr:hypothetical protein CAPTEDRAFT_184896 [Capitella teleta]|eukprot:ELT90111.1 hypothetical protein CAPTEDRAFT_184896 [Capitella teleta]
MAIILIACIICFGVFILGLLKIRDRKKNNGTRCWQHISPSKPFLTFFEWAKVYGDVYTIQLGSHQAIVLNSIEAAKEALLTNDKAVSGRPYLKTLDMLHQGEKKFVFASHCDSMLKFFRKTVLCDARKRCAQLDELIEQQLAAFKDNLFLGSDEAVDVDLRSVGHRMATNFAHGIAFGTTFDLNDPCLQQWEVALDEYRDLMHWFREENFFPVSTEQFAARVASFRETSKGLYKNSIEQVKQMPKAEGLVGGLLDIFDGEKNSDVENIDDVISVLRDVMFGVSDGSYQPLLWMAMYLAKNPDIQRRIHAEIDASSAESATCQRVVMPYLEATIREVLRHSELTTLGIPRRLEQDATIGNNNFTKDTIVIVNVFALHRDPRHWDAPEVFNPSRFLDDAGKLRSLSELSYLPFSTGQRSCVGQQMARNLLSKLFVKFYQRFEVNEIESDPIPCTVNAGGAFNPELKAFKVRLSQRIS